ncbi:PXA domain-containing protein [Umbelopsis sp. PMI_123]|nr:PXA domain-containing protein [Umbelopsis sp. PMI_123]
MNGSISSLAGRTLFVLLFLILLFGLCWIVIYLPQTPYYVFGSVVLIFTCLVSLLTLNFGILVIYVNYVINPAYRKAKTTAQRSRLQTFKPLLFTQTQNWAEVLTQRQHENERIDVLPIVPSSVNISESFDRLISLVIRDFVSAWFIRISQSPNEIGFPQAVESAIRSAAFAVKERLEKTDLLDVAVNRIIPKVTAHISDYRIAEMHMRGKSLERSLTQSDELDLLLASQYRGGKLHVALSTSAVSTKVTETAHLRRVVGRFLPLVIPEKEGRSAAVTVLAREIISCVVLQPICDMISEPDYWNQTINTQLSKAIREQNMVRKLREVLNRHAEELDNEDMQAIAKAEARAHKKSKSKNHKVPAKTNAELLAALRNTAQAESVGMDDEDDSMLPYDPELESQLGFGLTNTGLRSFEEFLKMIQDEKNLLDVKRIRNDIVTQIRKKKAQIVDREPGEIVNGEKVEDILKYIHRLNTAKTYADRRIEVLTGEKLTYTGSSSRSKSKQRDHASSVSLAQTVDLKDVLADPSGLSYLMEFMDRRGDMIRLQFWLLVEGFKTTTSGQSERNDSAYLDDVRMVYDMYFSEGAVHRISIPSDIYQELNHIVDYIQHLSEVTENSLQHAKEASRILAKIQQIVFQDIKTNDFSAFKRSDLYFKYLTTYANSDREPPSKSRRSLDDSRLSNSVTEELIAEADEANRPLILERAASARPHLTPKWELFGNGRAESDSELDHPRAADIAKNKQAAETEASDNPKRPLNTVTEYGRTRGHSRAVSDTSLFGNQNRFQSFGKFLEAPNDWLPSSEWYPFRKRNDESQANITDKKRLSLSSSIHSLETNRHFDEDDNMTSSVGTLDDSDRHALLKMQGEAYRTATVEAVEAEFQSIMDNGEMNLSEHEDVTDGDDDNHSLTHRPNRSAPVSPRSPRATPPLPQGRATSPVTRPRKLSTDSISYPTNRSSLLIRPSKYAKSSMAMPVSNTSASPAWTSASNSKMTSEVAHDEMDLMSPVSVPSELEKMDDKLDKKEDDELSDVHLAPPGDLMLAVKIEKLSDDIEKLTQQESIVDALIQKAEATQKLEELRILQKSKNALIRELHQIQYQKSQYESQEFENVLVPGRTNVSITNSTIGTDSHGDYALYVIEIHQVGYDGNYDSGWVVGRRYSEFYALHQQLHAKYPMVRMFDFPRKRAILKLQKTFVESRRVTLEKYLQQLIKSPDICKSAALRAFLSQQNIYAPTIADAADAQSTSSSRILTSSPLQRTGSGGSTHSIRGRPRSRPSSASSEVIDDINFRSFGSNIGDLSDSKIRLDTDYLDQMKDRPSLKHQGSTGFMRHIYKTVAQGIDDMLVGPSMLDLITQQLGQQVMELSTDPSATPLVSGQAPEFPSESDNVAAAVVSAAASLGLNLSQTTPTQPQNEAIDGFGKSTEAEGTTRFTDSLCDLFIEMFELREKNNWLRRQAVIIVLQQLFGGTVERKLRETSKSLQSEDMILLALQKITDSLWPNGERAPPKEARKHEQQMKEKEEANRKLSTWLPGKEKFK